MPKDGELLVLQVYQLSNIYFFITIHVKKLYFLGGGGVPRFSKPFSKEQNWLVPGKMSYMLSGLNMFHIDQVSIDVDLQPRAVAQSHLGFPTTEDILESSGLWGRP